MENFDFHVTYPVRSDYELKKIVNASKEGLAAAIAIKFSLHNSAQDWQLQFFSDSFGDWVDIDNISDIPEGGRLKIVVLTRGIFFQNITNITAPLCVLYDYMFQIFVSLPLQFLRKHTHGLLHLHHYYYSLSSLNVNQ